jgi:drug/metabolite transporter (DMT)-like permease
MSLFALVCTNWAYSLSLAGLKKVTAFAYILAINMQPIYAMLLAFVFFQEYRQLDFSFALGAVLVLASVFLYPLLQHWYHRT